MMRGMVIALLGATLMACETQAQGPASPSVQIPEQSCTPRLVTLSDGQQFVRTCGRYGTCAQFKGASPTGQPTTGLPFFLTPDGRPTRTYPGDGNCL